MPIDINTGVPVTLIEMTFDRQGHQPLIVRLANSSYDVELDNNTYSSSGELISISNLSSETKINSKGMTVTLSGLLIPYQALMQTENFLSQRIKVFIGMHEGRQVTSHELIHQGYISKPVYSKDVKSGNIKIRFETVNSFRKLDQVPGLASANAVQKSIWPDDDGFMFSGDNRTFKWKKNE